MEYVCPGAPQAHAEVGPAIHRLPSIALSP